MKLFVGLFLFFPASLLHGSKPPSQPDGEEVYRDNCTRCHIAFQRISIRVLPAAAHHMQVRALLTRQQQQAVLAYLLETSNTNPRPVNTGKEAKKP